MLAGFAWRLRCLWSPPRLAVWGDPENGMTVSIAADDDSTFLRHARDAMTSIVRTEGIEHEAPDRPEVA